MNLDFSSPVEVDKEAGLWVQWARPNDDFWRVWRLSKYNMAKAGVYIETREDNSGRSYWMVKRILKKTGSPPRLVGVPISPVPLKDSSKLLRYQIPVVSQLMASLLSFNKALDCSDTGTGKTYMSLKAARELGWRPGVVCTKSAIPEWRKVCDYFGVNPLFVINWESAKTPKFFYVTKRKDELGPGWCFDWNVPNTVKPLLIFDEIHKANGDHTQNQALLLGAASRYPVLGLSATLTDNIAKFRGVGGMLGLFDPSKFNEWLRENGLFQNKYDKWESLETAKDMLRLSGMVFPKYGARVRKSDVPGFPDVQNIAKLLTIKKFKSQNQAYERLLSQIAKLKEEKKQGHILALQTRHAQLAELNKVDAIVEFAKELEESGHHVPIFVNYDETLHAIADKLKTNCVIHGKQTKKNERQDCIEAFQSDREPFIVCNLGAGGQSISLHDLNGVYSRASIICPSNKAIDVYQVLGRIHRAGAKSKAVNYLVYSKGTIEEKIFHNAHEKIKNINTLNNGVIDAVGAFEKEGN